MHHAYIVIYIWDDISINTYSSEGIRCEKRPKFMLKEALTAQPWSYRQIINIWTLMYTS